MVSPLVIAGCMVATVIVFVIWSECHLNRMQKLFDELREANRQQWLAEMQEAESLKVNSRRNLIRPGDKIEPSTNRLQTVGKPSADDLRRRDILNVMVGTALKSAGKDQPFNVQILADSYLISDAEETPAKENSRWT